MAAAKDKTEDRASSVVEVELTDERGGPLGVTMKVEPGPHTDDVRELASRVRSWTKLVVDREPYTYSGERAVQLLVRYPHIARAVLEAGEKK